MRLDIKMAAVFVLALLIVGAVGFLSYQGIRQVTETNLWVAHTHQVMERLEHVLSVLTDAETGQRGYVLTGEARYLEPYNSATVEIQKSIDAVVSLTLDNAQQQESTRRLAKLSRDKLDELQATISLTRDGRREQALQLIRTDRGKAIMDDIRVLVAQMERHEGDLLVVRNRAAREVSQRTMAMLGLGVLVSLLLLSVAAVIVTRTMKLADTGPIARADDRPRWRMVVRYAFAVVLIALAMATKSWIEGVSGGTLPAFIMFYPAILVVASIAGGGPGVLATILSVLAADYWYFPPYGRFDIASSSQALALGIFGGSSLFLSVMSERLRRARWSEAVRITQDRELALLNMGNFMILDMDHRIVRWSEGNRRLYGFQAQEAQGRLTSELLQTDLGQPLARVHGELEKDGYWEGEATRRSKDGRQRFLAILWALRRDDHGKPQAILEIGTDITDRRRAEEAVRQQREWLRVTITSIGDAVLATDADGSITFLNPVAEHLTGWKEQEARGRPAQEVFRIINEQTRQPADDIVARVLREGATVALANHTAIQTRDGREIPIEDSAAPIKDGSDRITGVVLVFHDVTEKRRVQEELLDSRERLDLALRSARMATFDWDIVRNRRIWSDGVHHLLGTRPESFTGTTEEFFRVIHPDDHRAVQAALAKAVERDGAYETEYRAVWPDASVRHIAARGLVHRDQAGRPIRMTGICWDITERKQAEEALRERTAELIRSNNELEQFAYVSAHDLQEPLRQVRAFVGMLKDRYSDQFDAKAAQYFGFVHEGASRMSELVSGLLAYARVGAMEKARETTSSHAALSAALTNLTAGIAEANARITYADLPRLVADSTQLVQLFQNLVGNAIKFRREGVAPEIHIDAKRISDPATESTCDAAPPAIRDGEAQKLRTNAAFWLFAVRDNGIGIAPEYHGRLFQIFQRLHVREQYGGTGIGLAICKKIVERHGGKIWIESKEGEGSTFYFTWPAEKVK